MTVKGKTILHVITVSSEGGAQSVVVNLANAQCRENTVYVISSADGGAWKALDERVNIISIKQLRKKIGPWDFIVWLKLLFYGMRLRPDIVHLHSSKIGVLGRLAFSSKKIVYTVHGFDSIRVANRRFLFLEKKLQHFCRYIVGVSRYDEQNLQAEGIRRNVVRINNAVSDVSLDTVSDANSSRLAMIEGLRKRGYKKIIMTIAREEKPKRMDLFFEIARRLPLYAFVWTGNELDHEKPDNVFLLGMLPQAYQLLSGCDVYMLCSDFEGMPMSIIEALSLGRPVVASRVGGIQELLDGRNGETVVNEAEAFIAAIEGFCTDEQRWKNASLAARETYLAGFTVDKMTEGYDRIYASTLSSAVAP